MKTLRVSFTLFILFLTTITQATTYNITSASGFSSLPSPLAAGDVITIQDGTYGNVGVTLTAAGTVGDPVRMYAVNPGNVYFSGGTQFVLKGKYMIISGLSFDGDVAAGNPKYSSGVFRFEANSKDMILRDCLFRNYDNATSSSGAYWIQINGYRHTIEYCSFIGKDSEDQLISIIPTEDDEDEDFASVDVPRKHIIRHCYFADRTNIGLNGWETIQIGESAYQMYDMSTTVEYCLFDRAIYGPDISNYEPEVITSKSRNNIYRYNTFVENKGGLVLRHGDDCVVDGNYFFGVQEPGSEFMGGGLRISGLRHIVRNNYFEDIEGTGLRAAICLMKGSGAFPPDSSSNGYESPDNARIFHNTIVNCNEPFALGATTSSSGTNPPDNVEIRNNVVQSEASDGPVIDFNSADGWSISQIAFSDNFAFHPSGSYGTMPTSGFTTGTPVNLATNMPDIGYLIPQAVSPVINAAAATTPATYYDIRSKLRAGPSHDAGDYDTEGTGPSYNHPLVQADVGPVFTRTSTNRVPALIRRPAAQSVFEGFPATFSIKATSETDPNFGYQWRKDEVDIVGATARTFTIPSAVPADEGDYTVVMTNSAGRSISYPVALTVEPAAPVITSQPTPQLKSIGDNATFTVASDGIAPFYYQWRKDSAPIAGETNISFTITNIQVADAALYSVVVSNDYGTATSVDAELTLIDGNILLSDDFSDGAFNNNQSLPGSAKWYTSGGSLEILSNKLQVDHGRMALAFFMDTVGTYQSIAVGEQISATFTLNFISAGNSGSGFRFGFFDSNGQSRPPDTSDSAYTSYDGYIMTTTAVYPDHNGNTNGPITLRQRNPGVGGKLLGTTGSGNYSTVLASPPTSQEFANGVDYTVTLTLARTATGTVNGMVSVTGGALVNYLFSANDLATILTQFDGFAVLSTSSNGSDYTIDNVTVVHDVIVDSVGDGIPDWWRAIYYGTTTTNGDSCASCDFDVDGPDNLGEYIADTDPTNAASRLAIIDLVVTNSDVEVVWTGGVNASQALQRSNDLTDTNGWSYIFTNTPPTSVTNLLLDAGAGAGSNAFYRIEAWR